MDKTSEIFTKIATNTAQALDRTLAKCGFTLSSRLKGSKNLLFKFYILKIDNGSILVGTASSDDGSSCKMKFRYYTNGQLPIDMHDLMQWVEE